MGLWGREVWGEKGWDWGRGRGERVGLGHEEGRKYGIKAWGGEKGWDWGMRRGFGGRKGGIGAGGGEKGWD